MKQNTKISILDNLGIRRNATIEVGANGSFESGVLMDANAVEKLVEEKAQNITDIAIYNAAVSKPFPNSWPTNTTLAALCAAVVADENATYGQTYLGQVSCSGLPTGMGNGELKIEIIEAGGGGKLLCLTMVSTNLYPYHWERIYLGDSFHGLNDGEWRPYMPMQVFDSFLTALGTVMNGTWSYDKTTNTFTFAQTNNQTPPDDNEDGDLI